MSTDSTEREWLTSADPGRMVEILDQAGLLTHRGAVRKLRLYAAACCRPAFDRITDGRTRLALQIAERHAFGRLTRDDLFTAEGTAELARRGHAPLSAELAAASLASLACHHYLSAYPEAFAEVALYAGRLGVQPAMQAAILRDLFGEPFRLPQLPETAGWLAGGDGRTPHRFATGSANLPGGRVRMLVHIIEAGGYWASLPAVARDLRESGAAMCPIIRHANGQERCAACLGCGVGCPQCGGEGWVNLVPVHGAGCWVLDLLLGF